ncbi:unnamed protein product [Urochloa decumbens]|uniref:Peptidase A1 domain-containing protein n=1 Tax=Urochloa decumbens TaxID=240449 RepID=A0ABC9E6Q5_9POAL
MKGGSVLQVLSCVLFLISATTSPATLAAAAGLTIRADLTHVDSGRGFTASELLSRMASRSRARAASHQQLYRRRSSSFGGGHPATAAAAPGTVGGLGTEYLIHLSIGTPRPHHVALTLDTGSDLVWTQCTECAVCFDQPSPPFDPSASKTFAYVPCSDPICALSSVSACVIGDHSCFYLDSYGDGSITAGIVLRDTFTFVKGAAVPGISFGCGTYNKGIYDTNESGIAGFGLGAQSLPSQLKVGRFSHCFTSMLGSSSNKSSSPVFLGTPPAGYGDLKNKFKSTPLKRNPTRPSNYFVSFEGITVGETRLPVDASAFAVRKDGSGGTVIDSGTGVTTFTAAVYERLLSAFVAQVPLPLASPEEAAAMGGYPCFLAASAAEARKVAVPRLVFHLEGADMDLPRENYMPVVDGSKLLCVVVGSTEGDLTLIGNFQQQNMHIVYDVEKSKLLFAPAQCDKM